MFLHQLICEQPTKSAMDFNKSDAILPEEERESLIMNTYNNTGRSTVKVVEYMISSMSIELLCKFPDNSAFDFDYTQSSIWSPLVPHPSRPSSPAPELQRKLDYDDNDCGENGRELTENFKSKIADSRVFSCFNIHHKISKKKSFRGYNQLGSICSNSSGVVADHGCSSPIQSKGWKKVLKAASKQFKKTMKKRKESGAHLKLSHYYY